MVTACSHPLSYIRSVAYEGVQSMQYGFVIHSCWKVIRTYAIVTHTVFVFVVAY